MDIKARNIGNYNFSTKLAADLLNGTSTTIASIVNMSVYLCSLNESLIGGSEGLLSTGHTLTIRLGLTKCYMHTENTNIIIIMARLHTVGYKISIVNYE